MVQYQNPLFKFCFLGYFCYQFLWPMSWYALTYSRAWAISFCAGGLFGKRSQTQERKIGWNGEEQKANIPCALLSWSLWRPSELQSYRDPLRNCTEWSLALCSQGIKTRTVIYRILFPCLKIVPWAINSLSLPVCACMSLVSFYMPQNPPATKEPWCKTRSTIEIGW